MTTPYPTEQERTRAAIRQGARDAGFIVLGYIPFGLAMGAALVAGGADPWLTIMSSVVIFAGAGQIAGIELIGAGATVLLVVLTIGVINARHLLYSASLQPHLAEWPRGMRMLGAFFLADPVYAIAIARYERPGGAGSRAEQYGYYFAAGITCLFGWTALTVAGVLVGGFIPPDVPLVLAVPLTFLLIMLPLIKNPAGVVAATVGGLAALAAGSLPLGLSTLVGAMAGLLAGGIVVALTRDASDAEPGSGTDAGAAHA